jgi:hypothetical protein
MECLARNKGVTLIHIVCQESYRSMMSRGHWRFRVRVTCPVCGWRNANCSHREGVLPATHNPFDICNYFDDLWSLDWFRILNWLESLHCFMASVIRQYERIAILWIQTEFGRSTPVETWRWFHLSRRYISGNISWSAFHDTMEYRSYQFSLFGDLGEPFHRGRDSYDLTQVRWQWMWLEMDGYEGPGKSESI